MKRKIVFVILILISIMGLFSKTKEGKVKVGDTLPDFKLQDQHGNWVEASQFIGKKALVVYFYPKDDTPGCTKEACSFRDSFEDFKDIGAEVIGISADDVESHLKFAKKHRLPFILLSDKGNHVRDEVFGVPKDMFGLLPGRVTYIINKEGVIVKVFSAMSGGNHHTEALEVLK